MNFAPFQTGMITDIIVFLQRPLTMVIWHLSTGEVGRVGAPSLQLRSGQAWCDLMSIAEILLCECLKNIEIRNFNPYNDFDAKGQGARSFQYLLGNFET